MIALFFMILLLGGLLHLLPLSVTLRKSLTLALFGSLAVLSSLTFEDLPQVLTVGLWPHYAGITWVMDRLSWMFVTLTILIYLPAAWMLLTEKRTLVLFHFLAASTVGAFLSGDLFNLYVMFEILLLSSYALFFGVADTRNAKLFIWMNIVGSTVFVLGIACIYQSFGTVNFVELAVRFGSAKPSQQMLLYGWIALVFALKGGLWPFYSWLPESYPHLSSALLSFIAPLSAKVGVYAFMRWSMLVAPQPFEYFTSLIFVLALLTVFVPLANAFYQPEIKKRLSYFALSHIGMMFLIFSVVDTDTRAALLLYVAQDIVVLSGLFLSLSSPIWFLFFGLCAAGFPPLSAFWAKWSAIQAVLLTNPVGTRDWIVIFMLIATAFIYFIFVVQTYRLIVDKDEKPSLLPLVWTGACAALLSWIGMSDTSFFAKTAEEASQRQMYIRAVLTETSQTEAVRNQESESK